MSLSAFWRLLLFLLFQGCGGWVGNRAKSVLTSIRSLFIPALIRSVAVTAMGAQRDKSRKTRVVQQKQSESTSDHRKLTFTNNICNLGQLMSSPALSAVNSKHYIFRFVLSGKEKYIQRKKFNIHRLFNCKKTLKFKVLFLYEKFADGSCWGPRAHGGKVVVD